MSRSLPSLVALLMAVSFLSACDKVPLLAPTESTITLTASTTVVPVNGSAEITASVTESAGTPVQNGTVVTFTSSFGTIEPNEARTQGGKATVRFVASTQSGTARVGAFSGAARAEVVELLVGGAAATAVVVRAEPQTIAANGGSADIIATVLDGSGNPLPGVTVTFSTTAGQLSTGQSATGSNGEARTTLVAPRTATVTARAGGQTATVEVLATSPAVTITAPATIEAGIAATFTLTPVAGGNPIREVVVDWGDGTSPLRLGSVAGATAVSHVFARRGVYVISATVTDTQGISGTTIITASVNDQTSIPVTLTATPNPAAVGAIVAFQAQSGGLGSTAPAASSYTWDFGDGRGAVTTGATTSYSYRAAGTYIASVVARSPSGAQGSNQTTVRVQ